MSVVVARVRVRVLTALSAVAPDSPETAPGAWLTTTLAEEAFPAVSEAVTPIVFGPSASGTRHVKASPFRAASCPSQVTAAMPEPASRADAAHRRVRLPEPCPAPGESILSWGGMVSGAGGAGGEGGAGGGSAFRRQRLRAASAR